MVRARCGVANARRGTSLIELLVVVSIIALLFGILLPSMRRSISLASSTVCQSNLRQIGQTLSMYRFESGGWLPASKPEIPTDGQSPSERQVWFLQLYPTYLSDPTILTCPDDPFRYRMIRARDNLDRPEVSNYASYGINSFIMAAGAGALAHVDRFSPSKPLETILVADLGPDTQQPNDAMVEPDTGDGASGLPGPSRNASLLSWGDNYNIFNGRSDPWLTTRHRTGINIAALDGGVRFARTAESIRNPIRAYYKDCDNGGCTLCRELMLYHYSFAKDNLFWWTGNLPEPLIAKSGK